MLGRLQLTKAERHALELCTHNVCPGAEVRPNIDIRVGHVLDVLKELPEGSVQCVCCSPPYWGLRDYGIEPVVWGGRAGCEHEWGGDSSPPKAPDNTEHASDVGPRDASGNAFRNSQRYVNQKSFSPAVQFCRHCNAWRGSYGLEPQLEMYIAHTVEIFREVRRVMRDDGTLWLNLGSAFRDKQDLMIPAQVALALQTDGWWLRSEIIWAKKSPMPSSVTDRPTTATERIYLLTKASRYFYDAEADRPAAKYGRREWSDVDAVIQASDGTKSRGTSPSRRSCTVSGGDPSTGRNLWDYWLDIRQTPFPDAHFATFPPDIPARCFRLGTSAKGCCPKCGAPWGREVAPATGGTIGEAWLDHSNDSERGAFKTRSSEGYAKGHTTGWSPSCTCDAGEPVPCTVLDLFLGSGTSLLVAKQMGLRGIGIEINPEYAEMARRRIHKPQSDFRQPESLPGQMQLFD